MSAMIQPSVLAAFERNPGKRQDLIITVEGNPKFAGQLYDSLDDKGQDESSIAPLQGFVAAKLTLDEVNKFVKNAKGVRTVSQNRSASVACL